MAKFTIGHQKAAQQLRSAMSAEDRIVCAENLQVLHVNPKNMSFDDEFVERIDRKLDTCSIETLRNQKSVQAKIASGVSTKFWFDSNVSTQFPFFSHCICRIENSNCAKIVKLKRQQMQRRRLASPSRSWIFSRRSMRTQCPEFGQCWRQIRWNAAFQSPPMATIFSTIKTSNGWSGQLAKMMHMMQPSRPQSHTPNARNGYTNLSSPRNDGAAHRIQSEIFNVYATHALRTAYGRRTKDNVVTLSALNVLSCHRSRTGLRID